MSDTQEPMTLQERATQIGQNGQVTFLERIMVIVGVPAMLALTGWSLTTTVETRQDIATLAATLNNGLTPRVSSLEAEVSSLQNDVLNRRPFSEDDGTRMEARIDARLDRIQNRITSLEHRLNQTGYSGPNFSRGIVAPPYNSESSEE